MIALVFGTDFFYMVVCLCNDQEQKEQAVFILGLANASKTTRNHETLALTSLLYPHHNLKGHSTDPSPRTLINLSKVQQEPPVHSSPPLRYRAARHGGDAGLLAGGLRVLGVGADGLGGPRGGRLVGLRVVVGGGPPGHLPHRRPHVEHAALALQVAAFQLEDVELQERLGLKQLG